jgi:hypothetical protein
MICAASAARSSARSKSGEQIRTCYEASGAGYVLQRQLTAWGNSRPGVAQEEPGRPTVG